MDRIFFEKEGHQTYAFCQYYNETWGFVTKELSGIWRAVLTLASVEVTPKRVTRGQKLAKTSIKTGDTPTNA